MIVGSLLLLLAGAGFLVAGLVNGNDTYLFVTIVVSLAAAACLFVGTRGSKATPKRSDSSRGPTRDFEPDDEPVDSRLAGSGGFREEGGRRRGFETPAFDDEDRGYRAYRDDSDARDDRGEADFAPAADTRDVADKGEAAPLDIDVDTQSVPGDEPGEAAMSSVESAALMRMNAEVVVVDGRPRFHLGGCVHLDGRDSEALPAYEAVELGFGPCALCRPVDSLLQEVSRP